MVAGRARKRGAGSGVLRVLLLAGAMLRPVASPAREVEVVLLHFRGLRGEIAGYRSADPERGRAGLLAALALVAPIRETGRPVLLLSAGDDLVGSPESQPSQGGLVLETLAWAGVRARLPGPRDLVWGADHLERLMVASEVPTLAADVRLTRHPDRHPEGIRPWIVVEADGLKIGILGLAGPGLLLETPPARRPLWTVVPAEDAVADTLPALKEERPDLLILLAALPPLRRPGDDAGDLPRLLRRFPEFHAVAGGGPGPAVHDLRVAGVPYARSEAYANTLARLDLRFDTVRREAEAREHDALDVRTAAPAPMLPPAPLRRRLDASEHLLTERVGALAHPGGDGPDLWIARAWMEATKRHADARSDPAEAALLARPRFTPRARLISRRDLAVLLPVPHPLCVIHLTPEELGRVLTEDARSGGEAGGRLTLVGLRTETTGQGDAFRVERVLGSDGRPLHPRRRVPVALSAGLAGSDGGRLPVLESLSRDPLTRFRVLPVDVREAVEETLREAGRSDR